MPLKVTQPETETFGAWVFETYINEPGYQGTTTSIDILEVTQEDSGTGKITRSLQESLNNEDMVKYVENTNKRTFKPTVTLFLLKHDTAIQKQGVLVDLSTMRLLQSSYNIPPTYLYLTWYNGRRLGSTCCNSYTRYTGNKITGTELTYTSTVMPNSVYPIVHCNHDLSIQSSVYFIANAPATLVQRLKDLEVHKLTVPFMIDVMIRECYLEKHIFRILYDDTEAVINAEYRSKDSAEDIQKIHDSVHWLENHIAVAEDVERLTSFLLSVITVFDGACKMPEPTCKHVVEILQSQQRHLASVLGWYKNIQKRFDIQIDLPYNLRAQRDSETNLQLAKDTAKIAYDAQKDSASMITIAAVTMFFLPGTFICAVFSMVFFNAGVDTTTGENTFSVSPKIWYFFAATSPLTIAVFAVWHFWRMQRINSKVLQPEQLEEGPNTEDQSRVPRNGDVSNKRSWLRRMHFFRINEDGNPNDGGWVAKDDGELGPKRWFGWMTSRQP